MATFNKYRELAAEWHGGQSSELYKVASTGKCDDVVSLMTEIGHCLNDAMHNDNWADVARLTEFEHAVYLKQPERV